MAEDLKRDNSPRKLDGTPLTLADLPPATWPEGAKDDDYHWTAEDKANVLMAIESGLLTTKEAFKKYRLSLKEFLSWRNDLREKGRKGLYFQSRREVPEEREFMVVSEFALFPDTRRVAYGKHEVYLSPLLWNTFQLLISRQGEVVSHKDIMDTVETKNAAKTVGYLNRALSEISGGKKWILNIRNEGYNFTGYPIRDL